MNTNKIAKVRENLCPRCRTLTCPGCLDPKDLGNENDWVVRRYNTQKAIAEATARHIQNLTDLVNTTSSDGDSVLRGVAAGMHSVHRTLQQLMGDQILRYLIDYWADCYDRGYYDDRNEALCKLAVELKKVMDDHPLPYI